MIPRRNVESAFEAITYLRKIGFEDAAIFFDNEKDVISIRVGSILSMKIQAEKLANEELALKTQEKTVREKKEVPDASLIKEKILEKVKENSDKALSAVSGEVITIGERVRDRALNSILDRDSLKNIGSLAKTIYTKKYGKEPQRNPKSTFVYDKERDLKIVDDAINMIVEKITTSR